MNQNIQGKESERRRKIKREEREDMDPLARVG